jgi:hypothetical protein
MKYWQIPPEDSYQYRFSARSLDIENAYEAEVRFDGCIDIVKLYRNNDDDTIHICDLDDFIARLEEIRELAKQKFGNSWPI